MLATDILAVSALRPSGEARDELKMTVDVHPSQKRSSCERCRVHKLRCSRRDPADSKCQRCKRLGFECLAGRQKRIGRPTTRRSRSHERRSRSPQAHTQGASTTSRALGLTCVDGDGNGDAHKTIGGEAAVLPDSEVEPSSWDSLYAPELDENMPEPKRCSPFQHELDVLRSDSWYSAGANAMFTSTPGDPGSDPSYAAADIAAAPNSTVLASNQIGFFEMFSLLSTDHAAGITSQEAMARLSSINLGLHARTELVERYWTQLELNSFVCERSVLHTGGTHITVFLVQAHRDLLQILQGLAQGQREQSTSTPGNSSVAEKGSNYLEGDLRMSPWGWTDPPPSHLVTPPHSSVFPMDSVGSFDGGSPLGPEPKPGPLSGPLALLITSVYVQLIGLHDIMLYFVAERVKQIALEMSSPWAQEMPNGALSAPRMATIEVMAFIQTVVSSLERTDLHLGLETTRETAVDSLLSARQSQALADELEASVKLDIGAGSEDFKGRKRPARVRERYASATKLVAELPSLLRKPEGSFSGEPRRCCKCCDSA